MILFFSIALATISCVTIAVVGESSHLRRNLVDADVSRHSDTLKVKEVSLYETYHGHSSRGVFCQPDSDGYFGSITENISLVTYSFAMECSQDADRNATFSQIFLLLEDTLLGTFFPHECKYSRRVKKIRSLEGRPVTGFQFTRRLQHVNESCEATTAVGSCAVYSGVLHIFGNRVTDTITRSIYNIVQGKFDEDETESIDENILNIYSVNVLEQKVSGDIILVSPTDTLNADNTDASGRIINKSAAIAGIVASFLALVTGIVGLIYVEKIRRHGNSEHSSADTSRPPTLDTPREANNNSMKNGTHDEKVFLVPDLDIRSRK